MGILDDKFQNLFYNIDNGLIKHPLLNNIKRIIPIIVQTEGIFENQYIFPTHGYIKVLDNCERQKKSGNLSELSQ